MKTYFASIIVSCLSFITTFYPQQKDRWLRGEVVFVKENNVQEKQKRVGIHIKESGDRDLTDNNGIFKIYLKEDYHAGDKISLGVEKDRWEIQYPIYGEVYIPSNFDKELIKIKILPIGSPLFLTHGQILKFIEYSVQKNSKEGYRNINIPETNVKFDSTLKDWANHVGLTEIEVKDAFYNWLKEVRKGTDNFYEKGLAEYVKENYGLAAEIFHKSVQTKEIYDREITADINKRELEKTSNRNEIIRDARLEGESFEKNKNFSLAVEAYKKAVYYLEDKHDIDLLLSSLNKLVKNYYYLSKQKADYSKLNLLDSADIFLSHASDIVDTLPTEYWNSTIKGNRTIIGLAKSGLTMFEEENNVIREALKTLNEIEKKEQDNKAWNWPMTRHNISICYSLLYEHTLDLDSASVYLDSAISSSTSINDSLALKDFPLSYAYINLNRTNLLLYKVGFIVNKFKMNYWLVKYLNLFDIKTNNILNNCIQIREDDENVKEVDELLKESISYVMRSINFFRDKNQEQELAFALNLLADAKIKQLLYDQNYLSHENIHQIVTILNEADSICNKENFESERIYSQELKGRINPIALAQDQSLFIDSLISYVDSLSKQLVKNNYLPHFRTQIERNILLNHLIIIYITANDKVRMEYLKRAEFIVNDIINNYSGLMENRWIEEYNNFKWLINCIKENLN